MSVDAKGLRPFWVRARGQEASAGRHCRQDHSLSLSVRTNAPPAVLRRGLDKRAVRARKPTDVVSIAPRGQTMGGLGSRRVCSKPQPRQRSATSRSSGLFPAALTSAARPLLFQDALLQPYQRDHPDQPINRGEQLHPSGDPKPSISLFVQGLGRKRSHRNSGSATALCVVCCLRTESSKGPARLDRFAMQIATVEAIKKMS